jgi:hypothetical protein
MKVKEVIVAAAELIGDEAVKRVQAYLDGGEGDGELLATALLSCYNGVEVDLAVNYLPLKKEEGLETDTGAVTYASLTESALHIVRVTDEWGLSVRFDCYANYFKARVGKLFVTYTYSPKEKGLEEEVECHRLAGKRLLAYGVAAEYCLKEGLYDEAAVWEKKYKDAVNVAYKGEPCRRVKGRNWS